MYRLINIISEVVHVVPYENDFCYTTKQRELFFKDILLLQNIDPASIWNIKDFVFIHDADGNYIYLSQKRIIYSDYGVLTQNKDNNDCLIGYSTSKRISSGVYEKEYVILNDEDFTLSERLLKTTVSFCINDNRHLFGTDSNNIIICYNLYTKNTWHFDLSQFGTYMFRSEGERSYEVQSFIGVVDNVLWVEVSNCTLLALDIETGKLIRRINCLSLVSDNIRISDGSGNFILDEKNKRIVWLAWVSLFHINIKNGDIQLIRYFWDDNKNNRWEFGRRTLAEDKIYFVGKKAQEDFYFNKRVGIMDANSGEVLWNEKLDLPDSKGLDTPQVSEDKLYVLATNGDLYIFEKE